MAAKGGGGGGGGALSKQPSRVGEVSQREEKSEEPEIKGGKKKYIYIKSVWRTFLKVGGTHRCLFSDSRKSGGEFSSENLLQTLHLLRLMLK